MEVNSIGEGKTRIQGENLQPDKLYNMIFYQIHLLMVRNQSYQEVIVYM